MGRIDRTIVMVLAAGIWGLVVVLTLKPSVSVAQIDISSVVEDIVEDCTVSGTVYIHGMPYGSIVGGSISC